MSLVTNGEHSDFMRRQDRAMQRIEEFLTKIEMDLRCKNMIEISKSLYEIDKISKDEYVADLLQISKTMGATYKFNNE